MYSWINSEGKTVKTKTVKEFSQTYNFSYGCALALSSGYRARLNGWCSTNSRAKVHRARFLTKLVNLKTGETAIIGQSVKRFAQQHGLSLQGLSELVNNRVPIYRHWVKAGTAEILNEYTPDENI
jgi:hypothetical protein